jgi:hypothetical protein
MLWLGQMRQQQNKAIEEEEPGFSAQSIATSWPAQEAITGVHIFRYACTRGLGVF